MSAGPVSETAASTLARACEAIIESGGSVLIAESDHLLANPSFSSPLLGPAVLRPTLAYGQTMKQPGLHIIGSETDHWVENLTGIGASGAHLVLAVVAEHSRQGHPLVPVVQIAEPSQRGTLGPEDVDLFLTNDIAYDFRALKQLLVAVAELRHRPAANASGLVDFQFTRGLLGVTS
jgi:hypothetical protein